MENKVLEQQYIDTATEYVGATVQEDEQGKAIGWIGYGLDLREPEVAALKQRIIELGG